MIWNSEGMPMRAEHFGSYKGKGALNIPVASGWVWIFPGITHYRLYKHLQSTYSMSMKPMQKMRCQVL